jgi:predicted ATPase
MINKFSCKNFRNINAEELSFERINILIGPNNSGKTNFIKALTFYSEMLNNAQNGSMKTAFLNAVARNGWGHAHNKYIDETEPIEFAWEINNGEPLRYKFSYTVGNTVEDCNIVLEELNASAQASSFYNNKEYNYFRCHNNNIGAGYFSTATKKGARNHRLNFHLNAKEILSMQFKDILLKYAKIYEYDSVRVDIAKVLYDLEDFFRGFSAYTSAQFNTKKMREPAEIKNIDSVLNAEATNFVNVFARYKAQDLGWQKRFEEKMKDLIPNLETADSVNVYEKLIFRMMYGGKQYDLSDVSEGTLKGLILNMLINMPFEQKRSLLAIDEPETNLHPAWQKVVGNWIQNADTFQQCFISTHSPDFLDVFTEEFKQGKVAVFVFDNNSENLIKKVLYKDIVDELGEWELGDLYRTNDPALGGWPW